MALDAFCCTEPRDWSKIPICLQSIGIFGNVLTGVGQLSRNLEEALEELERDVPNSQLNYDVMLRLLEMLPPAVRDAHFANVALCKCSNKDHFDFEPCFLGIILH